MSRPLVSVFDLSSASAGAGESTLPAVMTAPIRPDIVQYVHQLMMKNKRQPYAVNKLSGMETPAISWGTGRAVSRIPRVPGGGTSRSGQGAFGNMCRGGRMFGATKIWRRWHRKISVNQRRYAVASALAASAVTPLVMARGHKIDNVPELPLVLSDSLNNIIKTKQANEVLKTFGAFADVEKCADSKKIRRGVGKSRNRRYTMRRGPLIVTESLEGVSQGFKNIPGVEVVTVDNLNLLDLAPGGHLGRFIIWTKGAFDRLDSLFGTYDTKSELKRGFALPHSMMTNNDLTRIINSDEIQSIVRPTATSKVLPKKRNPLKNPDVMAQLNPYAAVTRANAIAKSQHGKEKRAEVLKGKRAERKVRKQFAGRKQAFFKAANAQGEPSV